MLIIKHLARYIRRYKPVTKPVTTRKSIRIGAQKPPLNYACSKAAGFLSWPGQLNTNEKNMNTIVPLISSAVAGPLGVLHLPRFWLKVSLECRGKLAPGYPGCGKGYDQMVLDALGLKKEVVVDFVEKNRPTYPQFETWITKQPGAKLDKLSIDKLNSAIRGYIHDDQTRKSILAANDIPDDSRAFRDAVNLNNLDDWKEFHEAELK
jgi:hypothetical protein